jgi:hypothetical protein
MMMARRFLASFTLALAIATPAVALEPRTTVGAVAQQIEDNFFDASRAAQIARELRTEAVAGAYDRHEDPRDLAVALTSRLNPLDRHFRVTWSSPGEAGENDQAPGPRRRPRSGESPQAWLRRVELLPGNLGLIELRQFAPFDFADRDAAARRAIDAALQLVAWSDAVIIDLRDNGGGSPAMVGYLSSAFTAPGADIYSTFHSRRGTQSEAPAVPHPSPRLDVPLYVLISARTGSAAEAFAYTMKHAGRALIVGEASAGAANPGMLVDIGAGFTLFVSNGTPINPTTKRNWEGDGVTPDDSTPAADALRRAQQLALERLLMRSSADDPMTAKRWALEAVQPYALHYPDFAPLAGRYGDFSVERRDGALVLLQGRRPMRTLRPLPGDLFFVEGDPLQRVRFERDADEKVIALEVLSADGMSMWVRRE